MQDLGNEYHFAGVMLRGGCSGSEGRLSAALRSGERERTCLYEEAGNVPAGTLLSVIDSNVNERTCYRRLEFVSSSDPSARATLFLSPDQRFLTPQVLDLRSDPKQEMNEEERRIESEISSYLDGRAAGH